MPRRIFNILAIIQCFVALFAIPGGLSMILEPSGKDLGIPLEVLSDSPFQTFFIPGLVLFFAIGILQLVAAMFSFRRHQTTTLFGILLGFFLLIWICVQMYFIGFVHFLQPLFLIVAIGEIVLSILINRKVKNQNA